MEAPSGSQHGRLFARKNVVLEHEERGTEPKSRSVEALEKPRLAKIDQPAELLIPAAATC